MSASEPVWEMTECSPVQKTLLIPLAGRAAARELFPELGFEDRAAERVMSSVRLEGSLGFREDRSVVWGSILRTQAIDEAARAFLARHPQARVLNLGAGLCTRRERLGGTPDAWLDVDFEPVLEARGQLLPDVQGIAADLNDGASLEGALSAALTRSGSGPVLVIAEGVTMFLEEPAFGRLMSWLDRMLPAGSEVVFDYIHPVVRRLGRHHRSLRRTGAAYRTSVRRLDRALLAYRRLELVDARLFTRRYRGALRGTETLVRALMGGSALFDVARVRVGERREAAARRHWGVVGGTFAAFGAAMAVAAWARAPWLYAAAELAGALALVRAFCLVHELSHASLLPNRRLNDAAGVLASLVCALPYYSWKKIHIEHHTWAGYKDLDPTESDVDFDGLKPAEQWLANWAWRTWVPLLGFSFSIRTFWNYPRLARLFAAPADRRRIAFGLAVIPLAHGLAAALLGAAYLKTYLPAFGLFLFIMDPIMLSQHVGIPLEHPTKTVGGPPRPIRASEQESLARTLIFPRWFARHVLLGFNYHSLHHARPTLPGHELGDVPFAATHEEGWWSWLKSAKRAPLGELLKGE